MNGDTGGNPLTILKKINKKKNQFKKMKRTKGGIITIEAWPVPDQSFMGSGKYNPIVSIANRFCPSKKQKNKQVKNKK